MDPMQLLERNKAALDQYRQRLTTEGPYMLIAVGGVVLVAAIMFARRKKHGKLSK